MNAWWSLRNMLITAAVIVPVIAIGAGIYLLAWESAGEGVIEGIDFGNNWYQVVARGLGIFMIAVGVLGGSLLAYLAWRVNATLTANDHLERIALYTYEALEDVEEVAEPKA